MFLHEVHRVLKPDGFLSFYPGDPEVYHHSSELRRIKKQIEGANSHVESEHSETLVHEGRLVRGKVLNLRKEASR